MGPSIINPLTSDKRIINHIYIFFNITKKNKLNFKIFFKNKLQHKSGAGFTLIELLVVIAIIGILASIVLSNLRSGREAASIAVMGKQQRLMASAVELYFNDVGFYPPDVNRGWDPGFARSLPWNPDEEAGEPPPGGYASPGTNCDHCPSNWQSILQVRWSGPYMQTWPRFTPWKGKYDYNYWGSGANRYGCVLPAGVYVGVQGDYNNEHTIPESVEEEMVEKGFDAEQCINGESQMILWSLE